MKNNLIVPISIVIAGAIIGVAIFMSKTPTENTPQKQNEEKEKATEISISKKDHILGNPEAPITIVEYSDTECPFCKRFHETMRRVMDEYGKQGKIKLVYRHFPLDAIHPKTRKEAEATECANEIGGNEKFWDYINRLYEITPSNNGLDLAELPKIAEYVGLDKNKFNECLNSGKQAQKIEDQFQGGIKLGIQGTPYSIVINQKGDLAPINGAQPYENVKLIIDQMLSK